GPGVNVSAASIHPVTCGSGAGAPQEPQLVVRTRVTGEQSSVLHSETVATAGEQHTSPAPGPGPGEEGSVPHEGHGSGSAGMRLSGTSAHLPLVEEGFSDAGDGRRVGVEPASDLPDGELEASGVGSERVAR